MTQVIVYTNENGNVSVCYPSGELPIEDVLEKDCPEGAIIIDADTLPQDDGVFFNAWRLVGAATRALARPPPAVALHALE